jgi:isoquinoline 1-oxidoreductase
MNASGEVVLRIIGPPFSGSVQQTGAIPKSAVLLEIASDGSVFAYSGKVEYGQGIRNSFTRMIASTLEIEVADVHVILADTARVPYDRGTTGSASTRTVGAQLFRAANAAKNELAERKDSDGSGADTDVVEIEISGDEPSPEEFTRLTPHMGAVRIDGADRVTGKAVFAYDFALDGTAYGSLIRPPSIGAKLVRIDSARAAQVPGFIQLVQANGIIGVVGETKEAADRAVSFVRTRWDETGDDVSDWSLPSALKDLGSDPVSLRDDGDVSAGLSSGARLISGVYYAPYVANAQMEPSAATAEWGEDGSLTVWCANRGPFTERAYLAEHLGIDAEKIRVIIEEVGGSFGTKSQSVSFEAAVLARESGRAVKISYNRHEEFSTSTVRPAALMEIDAAVDQSGKLVAWDYTAFHAGDNAFRGRRGADSPYDAPVTRIRVADSPSPLPHGSYRSLGGAVNHFGREVHIETMARELGIDPLKFRLDNLSHPRYRRVLEEVALMSDWESRESSDGIGYGLAVGFDAGSYVAQVARVVVANGTIVVERVDVSFDCGQVFNPDGAINQIEGSVVMGMGTALWEEVEFDGGRVLNTGFGGYRVPRITDVPEIQVKLIEDPSNTPTGVGEPGIVPIAAAIANAVADATGKPVDRLPLQPQISAFSS